MLHDLSLLQVVSQFIWKLVTKKIKKITAREKDIKVGSEKTRRLSGANCTGLLEDPSGVEIALPPFEYQKI